MSIGIKQSSGPRILANQVWFITSTKHTIGRLNGAIVFTIVNSVGGNSVSFSNGVRVVSAIGASVILAIKIDMSSGSNYGISSNMEFGINGDPEDAEVYLGALLAMVAGPSHDSRSGIFLA